MMNEGGKIIDFCSKNDCESKVNVLGETKLIFWSTGKAAYKKVGRSVGKIKIILFDS